MKKTIRITGAMRNIAIAMAALIGFALISCGSPGDGNTPIIIPTQTFARDGIEKIITINNTPEKYFEYYGFVALAFGDTFDYVAYGGPAIIISATKDWDLLDWVTDEPFDGKGDFVVLFILFEDIEDYNNEEAWIIYGIEKTISGKTTTISFNDLEYIMGDEPVGGPSTYVITGTVPTFQAAKNGGSALATTGAIQDVINAIKTDAAGKAVTIQFGNGTDVLNAGSGSTIIDFNNTAGTWGALTLTGKITGAASSYLVHVQANVSATSSADIVNTNASGTAIRKVSAGTLTITGGTISGRDGVAVSTMPAIVNISGGTITGTSNGASCSATMNISGGTVTGTGANAQAVEVVSANSRLNVSGGTVQGTGSGARAIYIGNGAVVLSGTATVTSETTNASSGTIQLGYSAADTNDNNPVLTIGADVILTNTADGNVVYSPVTAPWKIVDSRVDPEGGNLSN